MARTNRFKPTEKQMSDKKNSGFSKSKQRKNKSELRELCKSY